jgi:hypothetical protein
LLNSVPAVKDHLKAPRPANPEDKAEDWVAEAQPSLVLVQVY